MSPWKTPSVEDPDDEFARLREWNGRRADRRYWVEVNGETAMALDHARLIVRQVDKQGKVVAGPPESGVVPESMKVRRAIDLAVRARSRSVLARGAEGREAAASEGEEDVRGVEFGGTAQELVEVVVDRVIDALRSSDPAVPGDVEFGPADGSEPPYPPGAPSELSP